MPFHYRKIGSRTKKGKNMINNIWEIQCIGGTIRAIDKEGNDVGLIADIYEEKSKNAIKEGVRNHNLVPELLDSLKEVLDIFVNVNNETLNEVVNARKIIAKFEDLK
jgi:hypothetical protein